MAEWFALVELTIFGTVCCNRIISDGRKRLLPGAQATRTTNDPALPDSSSEGP